MCKSNLYNAITFYTWYSSFFLLVADCNVNNGGCSQKCVTKGGKALCECKAGYILGDYEKTCEGTLTFNGV